MAFNLLLLLLSISVFNSLQPNSFASALPPNSMRPRLFSRSAQATPPPVPSRTDSPLPNKISRQNIVKPLFNAVSEDSLKTHLEILCVKFPGRFLTSPTGVERYSHKVTQPTRKLSSKVTISKSIYPNTAKQPSIIARIEGEGKNRDEIVVIGSHLDSIATLPSASTPTPSPNSRPKFAPPDQMPGCDDDGSGVVTLMEIFKLLMTTDIKFSRSVEFHWYAAEEAGRHGSKGIANQYKKEGKNVYGMMQYDMVGYVRNKQREHIAINTGESNDKLVTFMRTLVKEYIPLPVEERLMPDGKSDHASFTEAGYRAVHMFEDVDFNERYHTPNDTIEHISFSHVAQFAKLGLAYLLEMGM
ncbi:hypothetical protein BKA69DRAFT_1045827 [Paraphysoderma sedebokerense]|nr:hypothetical protein BKA69DRAFT_1045827 [Paraphysoderma sedebokerense]